MSSPTKKTLNVGLLLLGGGLVALLIAKTAKSKEAEPREGETDTLPGPEASTAPSPAARLFSVNGRSYRFTRNGEGYYTVELLGPSGVVVAYHYGPDGLEGIDGDSAQAGVIASDFQSFPQDIPEFSHAVVAPPSDSPVDYAPLD